MWIPDPSSLAHRFLYAQPWFAQLTEEVRQRLLAGVTTQRGARGEVLLRTGEAVEGWYGVLDGLVKIQSHSPQGRRSAFLGIPAGEWFGEGSVMKNERRRYDVIALRDTMLLCLPRDAFQLLRATSLPFCNALADQLNMRLGQAMAAIETERIRSPEQRLANYLGPQLWHGSRRIVLCQEELGVLAGLSRQTVNGVLKDFERRGLVSVAFGRIDILDDAGLADVAHGLASAAPTASG